MDPLHQAKDCAHFVMLGLTGMRFPQGTVIRTKPGVVLGLWLLYY